MEIFTIFSKLKMVESTVGELYTFLYKKTAHKYPELSNFFKQLAEEEKGHEKIIDMAKEYFLEINDVFIKNPDAESLIHSLVNSVTNNIAEIKKNLDKFQPKEIIQAINGLETDLESKHYSIYISISNKEIKQLLDSLVTGDQAHKEKIKFFLNKHNN